MFLKDISFETPIKNLLYDDVLLHIADKIKPQEYLRFWESPEPFVVLGRISNKEEDVNFETTAQDGVEVFRRSSGGGTVLQGPGCLNFSFILDKTKRRELNDLKQSYSYILNKVIEGLSVGGVEAKLMPISDIALMNNKKISGNAQKRGRNFVLHHGTIMYDFNLDNIARYLGMPKDMPNYRDARTHLDFVANINMTCDTIKKNIIKSFDESLKVSKITAEEEGFLQDFVQSNKITV
ncbi:MAG: lipoate-protein ligase A [Lysobacterales bacterium]|jgi:lipoate-protein ligase A